jgi:PPOX class probable F420-dependent enzyme
MAHLATIMPDGSPQVTAVAVVTDGDHILVSTTKHMVKTRNMIRDPRVAISMTHGENPWFSLHIRGRVIEIRDDIKREGGPRHLLDVMSDKHGRKAPPEAYADRLAIRIEMTSGSGRNSTGPERAPVAD